MRKLNLLGCLHAIKWGEGGEAGKIAKFRG